MTAVPLTVIEGSVAAIRDVWCAPAFGVLFDDGRVAASTAREALCYAPDLSHLPHVVRRDGAGLFAPPATAPEVARGALFAGWSGLLNYAHFLLASLPALLAAAEAPTIVPPLTRWKVDLITLVGETPLVVDAPVLRLSEAVLPPEQGFPDVVDPRVLEIRDWITDQVDAWTDREQIYLSRRDSLKAMVADEAEMEAALAARGFVIIRPETLTVRELVGVIRGARIVVGPSGTALANVLFTARETKVIEIRPPSATDGWTRDLAALAGLDWRGFEAAGNRETIEAPLEPRLCPASAFTWRVGDAFLPFLDEALQP